MEPLRSWAEMAWLGVPVGPVRTRVPVGALRLLTVVMVVFFSEDYLLKGEEKVNLSAEICCTLVSVARVAWMLRSLTCPSFI